LSLQQAAAYLRAAQPQEAQRLLDAHLQAQPEDSRAWLLLGACRHALRNLTGAAEAFDRTVELDPGTLGNHLSCVFIAREAGDPGGALAACERALQRFPGEAKLHYAAALALEDLGRPQDALQRYDEALVRQPALQDALFNRGLLLARMQRLDEAEASFRRCLQGEPTSLRSFGALADVLLAAGKYEQAVEIAQTALRLHPSAPFLLVRKALALASLRRLEDARQVLKQAGPLTSESLRGVLSRVPAGVDLAAVLSPENVFLERCYAALCRCDWSRWDEMIDEARRIPRKADVALEPSIGFMVRFLPLSETERHGVLRRVAQRLESHAEAMRPLPPSRKAKIRVGVLSPDFREHLNAYLLLPLFELIDRHRFELYAYSLNADDGSSARARVRAAAAVFRDLHASSDDEAARIIRRDDVDLLLDVGGYTTGARFGIVARRPARLHVNYLGFSCSLGSNRVDYAIVDRTAAPSPLGWSEALAYVPHTSFLYDYRDMVGNHPLARGDYGLPEKAFVFCAFHRAEKITPDIFAAWMQILGRTMDSVMWLHQQSSAVIGNLRQRAAASGIDPSRLVFAPFEPRNDARYRARQRLGDLFLDSPHHNATTTACDALGVGLPLLTLKGSSFSARIAAGLLESAGLQELVTTDEGEFVDLAVRLAADPAILRGYRERLSRNRTTAPLFDTGGRVHALEDALTKMWLRAQSGQPPESFHA